jgi:hypothetical protein
MAFLPRQASKNIQFGKHQDNCDDYERTTTGNIQHRVTKREGLSWELHYANGDEEKIPIYSKILISTFKTPVLQLLHSSFPSDEENFSLSTKHAYGYVIFLEIEDQRTN